MAGAAWVGKWKSESNAGGKYLLNKKPKISKSDQKGGFVGITAKNGNTAKAGDFRLFAARGVSFFVGKTFLFFPFLSFSFLFASKRKAIIYSKKSIKYSKFGQTSENQGVIRNSLIIRALEGVKMAVFAVSHLFSRVCKIRHKFNLTNVM
jgi:hypothetical protein